MLRIMSDNDVRGHVARLIDLCQTPAWLELWQGLECVVLTFAELGLAEDSSDDVVWRTCQDSGVILITGNRNADSPESLEAVIQREGRPNSLPVLTLADRDRIVRDRTYAESAVERLLEVLLEIEDLRGTGRLFLP